MPGAREKPNRRETGKEHKKEEMRRNLG